ncbi:hypothetical protein FCL40_07050 [Ferrimonas sediminicola]|uniref:Uncharacterized protein n=1 Tax=Ferrimonas sediminicola TaxID=2569538 RepID=A0A4U1BGR1_9GAMM|nr:hypothetical protein [Ferrimonas sediminicola]TKB49902.1 hypothetical protein FCL40_07050 [Ferrimonas sediminicola]
MGCQSLPMQLLRMVVVLAIVLFAVNRCDPLLEAFASQSMGSGCHSTGGSGHHATHHHNHRVSPE